MIEEIGAVIEVRTGKRVWTKDEVRRARACCEACQGIPTEALESGALKKALDALARYQRENQIHNDSEFERFEAAEDPLRALGWMLP